MVSQEYSGLDNADLFFPIESGRLDNFLVPNPEQYLPLYDTNQSFNDESQFPPQFEDFETHYYYLDVDLTPPFEITSLKTRPPVQVRQSEFPFSLKEYK